MLQALKLKVKYSLVGRMIRWLFYIESHTATVENIARNLKWQLQDSCIDQASRQRTKSWITELAIECESQSERSTSLRVESFTWNTAYKVQLS